MWHTGLVVLRHVGSAWTRARTCVPCIGRRILYHCATREVPACIFLFFNFIYLFLAMLGLRFCARAFSSCGKWGPLFIAVCRLLSRPLLLRSTGSRHAGSVVVAHGPSCSAACGIFPDQGLNPCPLHWQADSQPLRHQGSPCMYLFELWFSLGICPVVGLLGHTVVLSLVF